MNEGELIYTRNTINRREVLPDLYDVERIISMKECPKEGQLYFVKWRGYQENECTWEPRRHLPEQVIEEFIRPTVSDECIRIYSAALEESVRQRLKSRKEVFSVSFPGDLYRHVFNTTKEKLAEKQDFLKLNLRNHWDVLYRKNGVGIGLKFPVRITPILTFVNAYIPEEASRCAKRKAILNEIADANEQSCTSVDFEKLTEQELRVYLKNHGINTKIRNREKLMNLISSLS